MAVSGTLYLISISFHWYNIHTKIDGNLSSDSVSVETGHDSSIGFADSIELRYVRIG
jgi:hypothetical protein